MEDITYFYRNALANKASFVMSFSLCQAAGVVVPGIASVISKSQCWTGRSTSVVCVYEEHWRLCAHRLNATFVLWNVRKREQDRENNISDQRRRLLYCLVQHFCCKAKVDLCIIVNFHVKLDSMWLCISVVPTFLTYTLKTVTHCIYLWGLNNSTKRFSFVGCFIKIFLKHFMWKKKECWGVL